MKPVENILLVRLKSIGDVLFTLPAVLAVRDQFPAARLHFLVARENAELIRGFAAIDEIIVLDRRMFSAGSPLTTIRDAATLIRQLRQPHFDLAIDFQGYGETEGLAYFSGAPERWGNVYKPSRGWTYTRTSVRNTATHPVEWNLALLRAGGMVPKIIRNEYRLPAEFLNTAVDFFLANGLSPRQSTLFLQPFTSNVEKNWPLEKFVELARHFRQRGLQIIFGGGPADRGRLESVRAAGFCVAAGTPLMVSAGLMQLATVVIGGDTGLLHLATAMGRRVVMLMHSNLPGTCHPFQHPDWAVISGPSRKVAEIPLASVIAASDAALSPAPTAPDGNVSC